MADSLKSSTGMGWIDAPVSGGPEGAEAGSLAIMAGGTDEDIANATAEVRGQQEITALVAYLQQLGTVLEGTR